MDERHNTFLTTHNEAIDAIDVIRMVRNDMIKCFLDDQYLKKYLSEKHSLLDVSKVKLEFIKRSLQTLMIAPVDLEHYGRLILEMRKASIQVVPENHRPLFYQDIERAIKNYVY